MALRNNFRGSKFVATPERVHMHNRGQRGCAFAINLPERPRRKELSIAHR